MGVIMIWNRTRECMSRDERMDMQGKKLVALIKRVYHDIHYYRKKMQEQGLEPGDIRDIEDLNKLPYTTEEDLTKLPISYDMQMKCHTLSVSDGLKNLARYTANDIRMWSECIARTLSMTGLCRNDTIQVAYSYDLASCGLLTRCAIEQIGALLAPSAIYKTRELISKMREIGITGILCTPSHLLRIAKTVEELGCTKELQLKAALCGEESFDETTRLYLEKQLHSKVYDTYNISELTSAGIAGECTHQQGMHIQEDFFAAEVLGDNTHTNATDTTQGELVLTTLELENNPLVRYRTNEYVTITNKPCACGRSTSRITRTVCDNIISKESFMIRGLCISTQQLRLALERINDIKAYYIIHLNKKFNLDMVDVEIIPKDIKQDLSEKDTNTIKNKVVNILQHILGITPKTIIINRENNWYFSNKTVVILDHRNL